MQAQTKYKTNKEENKAFRAQTSHPPPAPSSHPWPGSVLWYTNYTHFYTSQAAFHSSDSRPPFVFPRLKLTMPPMSFTVHCLFQIFALLRWLFWLLWLHPRHTNTITHSGWFPVAEQITFSLLITFVLLEAELSATFSSTLWSFVPNGVSLSCPDETT